MVSFYKNGILVSLLAFAVSCGQDGVAPGLIFGGYDCDELVTQDLDATTFLSLLQDGASADDPFTVCIEENVTIGSTATQVSVNKTNLQIVGGSQTTSVINGLAVSVSNPTLFVRNLTLVPTTSGMQAHLCFKASGGTGSSRLVFDKVICSAPSAHSSMDASAFHFSSSGGGSINVTVSNSVITSSRTGITTIGNVGGNATSNITNNTLTVNGAAISFTMNNSSVGILNAGGNTMKYDGAGGGMNNDAVSAVGNNSSSVTANDISGSRKNFVCKVASSTATFSNVFAIDAINGSVSGGNYTPAGTQNGGNTIGNCP
jgi:hypothetical protein